MAKDDEGQGMVEHRIVIDRYSTAVLSIPKSMSALEFKALFVKANRLFNLSSVDDVLSVKRPYRRKGKADAGDAADSGAAKDDGVPRVGKSRTHVLKVGIMKWTPEIDAKMLALVGEGKSPSEVTRRIKAALDGDKRINKNKVAARIYYLTKVKGMEVPR